MSRIWQLRAERLLARPLAKDRRATWRTRANARQVFRVLAALADRNGMAAASIRQIAAATDPYGPPLGENETRRALRLLVEIGWIVASGPRQGWREPKSYRIVDI